MTFLIHTAEVAVITCICRTKLHALINSGQFCVVSQYAKKNWFCLTHVLECLATLHSLPPPDAEFVETQMKRVFELRGKRKSQRK